MNLEQTAPQPSQAQSVSSSALATTLHSSRTSPFLPPTLADREAMATPGFLTATQAFRPLHSAQSQFSVNMPSNTLFERESIKPVGTPFASSPAPMVRVLIRRLPLNTSEESLRLMVVWSKDLANVELLPIEQSEDKGFRSAILRFKNMAGAMEATNMLDGRSNISNDAEMIVEVLSSSPISARRLATDSVPANGNNQSSSAAVSSAQGQRQPQRFNGAFQPLDKISSANGLFSPAHEFPNPESSSHYQSLFSPQSPIGNHLTERGARISGKTLISSDFGDDDETSDLLKDPVAYAENGATSQRRATAPQIPISQMNGLSLNTSNQNGPSSLPPYITSMSPVNAPAPGLSYPGPPAQPFGRHNFPPVNPADQNPPCNTLYVGNLPIDTSEEELKAMFSKQRGYKRLCFRTKQNGPMCFVEFEDISFATKALHELYGHPLHNSVKGGIRLSFSKNPLGVRSGQAPSQPSQGAMAAMNGMMAGSANGFTTANGPPPGLSAPPGLGTGRVNYNLNTGGTHRHHNAMSGIAPASGHPWNAPLYHNGMAVGHNAVLGANTNHLPRHMMGR